MTPLFLCYDYLQSQITKNYQHSSEMSKWSDPSPHLIRRYRLLLGMTIAEASIAVKTSPARICDWENGKHKPTARSLAKLAKAYNCDISDFYEADIATVRTLATGVIVGYFNDPDANVDRKASVAAHLITQLPDVPETDGEDDGSKPLGEVFLRKP